MATNQPCMWGARIAVPLGWGATVDDVRALVDAVHQRIYAGFPMYDFFLTFWALVGWRGACPSTSDILADDTVALSS